MHEDPKVLSTTEARQGSRRKMNFRVLIMSMLLALVAGGVLYAVFYNRAGQGEQSTVQEPVTR